MRAEKPCLYSQWSVPRTQRASHATEIKSAQLRLRQSSPKTHGKNARAIPGAARNGTHFHFLFILDP